MESNLQNINFQGQKQVFPLQNLQKSKTVETKNIKQSDNGDICSGCQQPADIKDPQTCIPQCTHRFHQQCLKPWLEKEQTCPICRSPLTIYYIMAGRTVMLQKKEKNKKKERNIRLEMEMEMLDYMDSDDESFHEQSLQMLREDEQSVLVFSAGQQSEQSELENIIDNSQNKQKKRRSDSGNKRKTKKIEKLKNNIKSNSIKKAQKIKRRIEDTQQRNVRKTLTIEDDNLSQYSNSVLPKIKSAVKKKKNQRDNTSKNKRKVAKKYNK